MGPAPRTRHYPGGHPGKKCRSPRETPTPNAQKPSTPPPPPTVRPHQRAPAQPSVPSRRQARDLVAQPAIRVLRLLAGGRRTPHPPIAQQRQADPHHRHDPDRDEARETSQGFATSPPHTVTVDPTRIGAERVATVGPGEGRESQFGQRFRRPALSVIGWRAPPGRSPSMAWLRISQQLRSGGRARMHAIGRSPGVARGPGRPRCRRARQAKVGDAQRR